jgi:hypothetical protein
LKKITNGGTTIEDLAIPVQSDYGTKDLNAVANIFRECSKATIGRAVSIYYEDKNQYHISVPYYTSANNDLTIVWNLDSNTFAAHEGWNVKACAPYRYYDSEQLYRSHNDQYIYQHDTGSLDVTTPISYDWQTGWNDVNGLPDRKRIRLFFPVIFGADGVQINYEILKDFESSGSGFTGSITHVGASWFGYAHWGYSHWGQGGEILYRKKALVKGKVFSVRFFGSSSSPVGVAGYQFFYQPRAL